MIPIESRAQYVARLLDHSRFKTEDEYARARGHEVIPCHPDCDYDGCTGWALSRPRALACYYLSTNAEALANGRDDYHAPNLWERTRW